MPAVVHLLGFVHRLADDHAARDRFRAAPGAVLDAEVDDAGATTGEDVDAVTRALRSRVPATVAERVVVVGPVRPLADETGLDAALRLLVTLCDSLDGPAVEPVTLRHRELVPDPPPPRQTARGGGEPVPTEPPGGRWLHPVIPDDVRQP